MKKVAVMLVVMSFLLPSLAMGQSVDLDACTDQELVSLLEAVQQKIVERRIEKTALLQTGTYVAGKDFPAGRYVLAAAGKEGDSGIVDFRHKNVETQKWDDKLYEYVKAEMERSFYIDAQEGDELTIPFPHRLTISVGIVFQ